MKAARIVEIGSRSGFAVGSPILVRIGAWSRAEGVKMIFIIMEPVNLIGGLRIIKLGYDRVWEDKGHS